MRKCLVFIFLTTCFCGNLFSGNYDSLFIASAKSFTIRIFGVPLKTGLYEKWADTEQPNVLFYVSYADQVKNNPRFHFYYKYTNNALQADSLVSKYNEMGYSTFLYNSWCNADALLNKRFISYGKESMSFVIMHELTHNLFIQENLSLPYEIEEAACDVVGNYGTLLFAQENKQLDQDKVRKMIALNEMTYQIMNEYILKIDRKKENESADSLCRVCSADLAIPATEWDKFQKDRFDYQINTAYLLKNYFYCHNYFLLRSVFLKAGSIRAFLQILRNAPNNKDEFLNYLEKHKQ